MDKIKKFISDNDTNILIGMGIGNGFIFGSRIWYKTGQKVQNIVANKEQELGRALTFKEKVKSTWKVFIFPLVNTAVSAGAIIYATKVNNKRLAALGAAYNLTEVAFQQYIDKTKEIVGEKKAGEINQAVAKESSDSSKKEVSILATGKEDIMIHEPLTDRWFKSSWDRILSAALDLNLEAASSFDGKVSLTQWFYHLGLEKTDISDELGWDVTKHGKYGTVDVYPVAILNANNEPCIEIHYGTRPEYFS